MTIRSARLSDFAHLETFVWQAIFPAFDIPGLTEAQKAENDALVAHARSEISEVLDRQNMAVYVATEPKTNSLAGYIIVDASPGAYASITRLIVKRSHHGKGVAALLLDEATSMIGTDRAVSLAVRHYNKRAIAFFQKHGFINTREIAGNHAIPRTLMLREANTVTAPESDVATSSSFGADFPSAADEPVFEELPDYTLATDDSPLFETGANALRTEVGLPDNPTESYLSEDQLSVLEAFIAKARSIKGDGKSPQKQSPETKKQPPVKITRAAKPHSTTSDKMSIPFEVDYGEQRPAATSVKASGQPPAPKVKSSFAFDFAPVREGVPQETVLPPVAETPSKSNYVREEVSGNTAPDISSKTKAKTKECPDCTTKLPIAARFCYVCGLPQEQSGPEALETPPSPPLEEQLELRDLSEEETVPVKPSTASNTTSQQTKSPRQTAQKESTGELRKGFKAFLSKRIEAYFGDHMVPKYLARLELNVAFQQVRDGSLLNLSRWLDGDPEARLAKKRKENTFADLAEYFIVETAADLNGQHLPQRLLRHQSIDWRTADIFRLVMDYLDFEQETETVYTDFVTMPARALKNATRSFLQVAKDERIYFICDQSLIAQGKNGFAISDSGIYWKNVLQPPGAATFTTIQSLRLEQGHILIDGQFFNAGGNLNLKVALLLDKLRRIDLTD